MSPFWIAVIVLVFVGFLLFGAGFLVGGTCGRKSIEDEDRGRRRFPRTHEEIMRDGELCKDCRFLDGMKCTSPRVRVYDYVNGGLCLKNGIYPEAQAMRTSHGECTPWALWFETKENK